MCDGNNGTEKFFLKSIQFEKKTLLFFEIFEKIGSKRYFSFFVLQKNQMKDENKLKMTFTQFSYFL